jgi:hypothetical protein
MRVSSLAVVLTLAAITANAQPKLPADAELTKPYKQVTLTAPAKVSDPSFVAFRAKLSEAGKRKDRAALAKLVSSKGFFWDREGGNAADKRKPPIDNLAAAIGLAGKDGAGWELLAGAGQDPTGAPSPEHAGTICAPADPGYDAKAMQEMLEETGSDVAEWGYPVANGVEVRDKADLKAPATQKLGLYFVRVAPDVSDSSGSFLRIVTPAGKYAYVLTEDIAPLGNDQLCYARESGDWKIVGYIGVGPM